MNKGKIQDRGTGKFMKFVSSPITIFFLAIALFFVARGIYRLTDKYQLSKEVRGQSEARLEALLEQKRLLEEEIEILSTPEGIEAELRRNLGVVREGEEVLHIIDETDEE